MKTLSILILLSCVKLYAAEPYYKAENAYTVMRTQRLNLISAKISGKGVEEALKIYKLTLKNLKKYKYKEEDVKHLKELFDKEEELLLEPLYRRIA